VRHYPNGRSSRRVEPRRTQPVGDRREISRSMTCSLAGQHPGWTAAIRSALRARRIFRTTRPRTSSAREDAGRVEPDEARVCAGAAVELGPFACAWNEPADCSGRSTRLRQQARCSRSPPASSSLYDRARSGVHDNVITPRSSAALHPVCRPVTLGRALRVPEANDRHSPPLRSIRTVPWAQLVGIARSQILYTIV
jgi:hypothetical protein